MNRPKKAGTGWETACVATARAYGLIARRLAEGGSLDEADIEVFDAAGKRWLIECKFRSNLNVHQALHKARRKAGAGRMVAVAWKKLARKDGNLRRTADGEPSVIVLPLPTFFALLAGVADEGEDAA